MILNYVLQASHAFKLKRNSFICVNYSGGKFCFFRIFNIKIIFYFFETYHLAKFYQNKYISYFIVCHYCKAQYLLCCVSFIFSSHLSASVFLSHSKDSINSKQPNQSANILPSVYSPNPLLYYRNSFFFGVCYDKVT